MKDFRGIGVVGARRSAGSNNTAPLIKILVVEGGEAY
jgi:hypothetical protein